MTKKVYKQKMFFFIMTKIFSYENLTKNLVTCKDGMGFTEKI